jgi:hypothetical protein
MSAMSNRSNFTNKISDNKLTVKNPTTFSSQNSTLLNQSNFNQTPKFDKKIGGTSTVLNNPTNLKISPTIKTGGLDTIKADKLGNLSLDAKKLNIDPKFIKNDKFLDKGKVKDFCKDKCHDICHDKCYKCCPWWYCWNYPTWCPLYHHCCGYWYDVPVVVIREGVDLQLLAVRTIDAGDPEQQLGPAFRVWIRNNSPVAIVHPFNVLLLAGRNGQATADLPQAGVRIESIQPGQTLPIDIRLPVTANQPGLPMLHVVVDSHREIPEVFEDNNGAVMPRADILPVELTQAAGNAASTAPVAEAAAVEALAQPTTAETSDSELPLMLRGGTR